MLFIKCPECGKEISDKAMSCPNCGHPIEFFEYEKYNIASNGKVKACVKCGREIPKSLYKCPFCGKSQHPVLNVVGIVFLVIVLLDIIIRL